MQVYSHACEHRAGSHFQHISNFTRANGLCKYRNWYHSQQLQDSPVAVKYHPWLLFPRNTTVYLTDRKKDVRLGEWTRLTPHACERSYHAAPNYGTCRGDVISAVDGITGVAASPYYMLYPEQADASGGNPRL